MPAPNDLMESLSRRVDNLSEDLTSFKARITVRVDEGYETTVKLERTMSEVMTAVRDLTRQVSDLVEQLRQPLEDWNKQRYGMLWFKETVSNAKYYVAIAAAALVFWKFDLLAQFLTLVK